jgi:hypothetical protein
MTVKELIAHLQTVSEDLQVFTQRSEHGYEKVDRVVFQVHRLDTEGNLYRLDEPAPADSMLGIIID